MSRIRIFTARRVHLAEGFGSFHSRSTVMGGSAILVAGAQAKESIRRAQAEGRPTAGLAADGTFATIVILCLRRGRRACRGRPFHRHVAVLEYVTVADLGKIINPLTAAGQAIGAVVQGLGGTFSSTYNTTPRASS